MKALLQVFYQPGKVFAGLPERNYAWVVPMLFVCLFSVLSYWLIAHYIGMENIMRANMEKMARFMQNVPPERIEEQIRKAGSPASVYSGMVTAFFSGAFQMVAIAGILMAFASVSGKRPRFGSMVAMVSLAWFPFIVILALMSWLTLSLSPDPSSLNYMNLLATNVGAFMNRAETPKALYALLSAFDILAFIEIALLSIGFSKLTKAKFGFSLAVILGLWIVTVLFKVAFGAILG